MVGVALNGVSQSDFLKKYKSPDFNYRTFSVGLLGNGDGGAGTLTNSTQNNAFINLDLNFYQRANSSKYQGMADFSLNNSASFRGKNTKSSFHYSGHFNALTLNRIFFTPQWFVGLHDRPVIATRIQKTGSNFNFFSFNSIPTISIGKGRIEPVRYARNAMDIDYLLSKSGVLTSRLNKAQLEQLSNQIAVIQNKRFFDIRKARIYQLQSMDSIMQKLGLPIERNAVYFSDLQDAYLYGRVNERLSGVRHEFGVAQGINLTRVQMGNNAKLISSGITKGFYNFSYYLPQSYKTQHEIQFTAIGGGNDKDWGTWLASRYSFGFYPNTRTGMNLGVFANGSYFNEKAGFYAGLNGNMYYFISPRLRFTADFSLGITNDYTSHGMQHIQRGDISVFNSQKIQYKYNFGLRYSIF